MSGVAKECQECEDHITAISARADEASEAWKRAQNSIPIPWTEALYNEARKSLAGAGVKKIDSTK